MASYLSYFTSNSSSAPTQQQYSQAQPATSTWASTFSSRIATLRKALTKDSEEDDPDNEDCSHVSNVLRAYYTQKGRQFPEWLPPDPKKPQPAPQMQQPYGQYGNMYGNPQGQSAHNRGSSGGAGLSDLWNSGPVPQRQAPQSLRAPRPTPQSLRPDNNSRPVSNEGFAAQGSQPPSGARPLPSQRAGSYQNAPPAAIQAPSRSRLRAQFGSSGSGRNSPASSQGTQGYNDSGYAGQAGDMGGASHRSSASSQPWPANANAGYDNYSSEANYDGYVNPAYRQRSGGQR